MASAAEQMAANMSWGAFGKATELRQRILFTIGLLMVYRLGTYIPVPGIDGTALRSFMEDAAAGIGGVYWRCVVPHGHLCTWYYAIYFCVDYRSVVGLHVGTS